MNHPEKTLMGKFAQSQGRLSESSPPRSDGSRDSQNRGAGPRERWPKVVKVKLAQRGASGLSPLRSDGSRGGLVRSWALLMMAKGAHRESWKTTLGSQGT